MKGTKERKKGGENMCWKWGMFVRNTYVTHTYKPRCLGISAPALAGLALGVYSSPPTSFFLRYYLSTNQLDICLYYIVNISTCTYSLWPSYINRLWARVSSIPLPQTYLRAELEASISSSSISHLHISITFTMKDSKNYHVSKLKESENYESWKKNIISVLKVKDLWMIISRWLKKSKASKFNASTADTFSTTSTAFISTAAAFVSTAAAFVALTAVRKKYVIAAHYWANKNDRVCDMIIYNCEKESRVHIFKVIEVIKMWFILKTQYEQSNLTTLYLIIKELNHSKQLNFKFIQNYVNSLKWVINVTSVSRLNKTEALINSQWTLASSLRND